MISYGKAFALVVLFLVGVASIGPLIGTLRNLYKTPTKTPAETPLWVPIRGAWFQTDTGRQYEVELGLYADGQILWRMGRDIRPATELEK